MGFMSALGKGLKAPFKAPGMGAITKPLVGGAKAAGGMVGAVPGVRNVAGSIGLGNTLPPRQGIGPSPNSAAFQNMAQGAMGAGQRMMRPQVMPQGPPDNAVPDFVGGGPPGMNVTDRMGPQQAMNAPPNFGVEQGPPDPQMQQMMANRMAAMQQQQRPMGPSMGMMGGMFGQAQGPMRRPMMRGPMQ